MTRAYHPGPVVVTGIGAITAMGPTAADLWAGVKAGRVAIRPVAHLPMDGYRTQLGGEVADLPGEDTGFRDRAFDLALIAAEAAAADAGAAFEAVPPARRALVIGTCNGGLLSFERWYQADRLGQPADARLLLQTPPQALAEALGAALDVRGPVHSLNTACASGANAIGWAADLIRLGRADLVVAGGADALSDIAFAGFNALGSLSPEPAAPYSKDRSGLSLGEGSGMLVLMGLRLAQGLGAPVLAEVAGYGLSGDGYHPTAPNPDGDGASRAIVAALAAAGVTADAVGYVNGHGTGTAKNDPAESRAIRRALNGAADTVAVSSTKSMIGHLLGAAGAVEGIVTVQALCDQLAPPTANFRQADPKCDLDYLPDGARPIATEVAISNNFAFGGANACVVFRRPATGGNDPHRIASREAEPVTVPERSVITGVAAITPAGDLGQAIKAVAAAAEAHEIGLLDDTFVELIPAPQRRKLDRLGKVAVAAATLALSDSGLCGGHRVGVLLGTAIGPMESMEAFMRPLLEEGPAAASPALFPNTVYNAAAGQVGIILGTLGPTSTVTAGHAAGAAALGYCADIVGRGEADAMLCVAADTLTPTVVRAYRETGAVGQGLRLAEGAVALVVERAEAAEVRGSVPRATILGHGSASDAAGIGRWAPDGSGVERAIRAALCEAGVGADEVDVIWPNACGLRSADQAEEAALDRIFAGRCPTRRPKRAVGDALGAGGPLNVALALAAPPSEEQIALFVSSSLGGSHVATVLALHPGPGRTDPRAVPGKELSMNRVPVTNRVPAMNPVQVLSTGSYLPGDPIDNEQLARLIGPLPAEVLAGIQVEQRYWMIDPKTGRHQEQNSEMATKAARRALARADVDPAEVDLIIVSTSSPEYPLPPMATFVQEKLGLRACTSIEIRSGCAGAVEAFEVASMYLETGRHRTAVVIGSEAISPIIAPLYVGLGPDRMRMRDRLGAYNFGDGAGAIVLRAGERNGSAAASALAGSAAACVGGNLPPGMQIIGGGTDAPAHEQLQRKRLVELKIDVTASARLTPAVISEGLADLFRRAAIRPSEVDHFVVPEGNAGYLRDEIDQGGDMAAEWAQLESRLYENLSRVGATGSAAVPLALDDAWSEGRLSVGDMVLLLAIETSKWKYAGALFRWTAATPAPVGGVAASPARALTGARS